MRINLIILLFLIAYQKVYSLDCTLKLTCKQKCENARVINSINNNESSIALTIRSPNTENTEYAESATFICEPGDKIKFSNIAYLNNDSDNEIYNGGFIGILTIKDNANVPKYFNSYDDNTIFICDICSNNPSNTLKFYQETVTHEVLEYSGTSQTEIEINIPYEVTFKTVATTPLTIPNSHNFQFQTYVSPSINGANINIGRVYVNITSIPDINLAKFKKGSTVILIGNHLSLDDSITFSSEGNNFGLFELKYTVVIMNQKVTEEHSIKFNVCYKYCSSCNLYSSINPLAKICTACLSGSFFIDDATHSIEDDRCFSLSDEISISYTNYFVDTDSKYRRCDASCKTCHNSNMNCIVCNKDDLYYFVDGKSSISQQCFPLNSIIALKKYYLYDPPNGDKFFECSPECETCRLNSNNCFSCLGSNKFYIDEINKCQTKSGDYYLFDNTYITKDSTCAIVDVGNNKKKCSTCMDNSPTGRTYYKFRGENYFCYLIEEVNYKYGTKIFLDKSETPNHIIDSCDPKCFVCENSKTNCLKCSPNYYFVNSSPSECQPISYINAISDGYKYYLPKGGDTYLKCDLHCICEYKNDYCIGCIDSYIFKEDENTCKPQNTDIQGYYIDNNIYKKCHDSCLTCNSEGADKCTSCAYPYYPFKLDNTYMRCITQIEKKKNSVYDNYFLKKDTSGNNIEYQKCDESCSTCEDGENNNQCIKCNSDYVFYEGETKICKKKDTFFNEIGHVNYYFNEVLNEFRKCHKSCKSCKDGDRYNNCYECDTNYVFIDDPANGKCVLKSIFQTELKNYYKEQVNNHQLRVGTTTVEVYKKCPENCAECNKFEDNPLKCLICNTDKGYYKRTLTIVNNIQEECYNDTIMDHYYYNADKYLPSNPKCLKATYETQTKEKCLECHNKYGYYSLEHDPETCQNTIPEDHYVSLNNLIMKCPYECASCSEGPTSTSTNCDACKEEFPPTLSNPKNCEFKCEYYQYRFYDNKYCTGEKECPDLVPYLIKENATCVQKCERVSYYGICLDECPPKTINNAGICQDSEGVCNLYQSDEIREHLVDLQKDISPVTKRVKKYYKYFSNTHSHVDIYTHYLNEYTMIIYQKKYMCKRIIT